MKIHQALTDYLRETARLIYRRVVTSKIFYIPGNLKCSK